MALLLVCALRKRLMFCCAKLLQSLAANALRWRFAYGINATVGRGGCAVALSLLLLLLILED